MRTKKTSLFIILMTSWALSNSVAAQELPLNAKMKQAATSLSELMPFIYDDDAFRSLNNKGVIEHNLSTLISVTKSTPKLFSDHAVTMQISQQSLLATLEQANSLYQSGSYATAQYLLSGVPMVCSSCHIQDGKQSKLNLKLDREDFANDFSFAEFNYYLRNYQQAQSAYENYLNSASTQESRIQSRKTLERLLDISLLTSPNADTAIDQLNYAKSLPKLNNEARQVIQHWLTGLKALKFDDMRLDELEQAIYATFDEQFTLEHEFIFQEENRPKALLWRKQLHQQLRNQHNNQNTARALYLLSILERALGDQIDVSLANLYLKECVHLKARVYSAKCINEFENHLNFYYGGSSGDHLPTQVYNQLQQLKKSVSDGNQ